jgi:hypothetical protein
MGKNVEGKVVISSETLTRSRVQDFNPVAHEYEAGVLITRQHWSGTLCVQFRSMETIAVTAQQVIFEGWQPPVMGSTWGLELAVWRNDCSAEQYAVYSLHKTS